jgi:CRP-like cAMP-binding protein
VRPADRPASLPLPLPSDWPARLRARTGAIRRALPAGRWIPGEGGRATHVHVVEDGAIALGVTAVSGRRATVAILSAGDVAGVPWPAPMLGRRDRSEGLPGPGLPSMPTREEVRALVDSSVLSVPVHALDSASRQDPEIARWLAESFGSLAERLHRRLVGALLLSVGERLAEVMGDLAGTFGRPCRDLVRIDLPLSQELLASVVGATRESVNRALRGLEAAGLVERRGRTYFVSPTLPSLAPRRGDGETVPGAGRRPLHAPLSLQLQQVRED